jgi:hypothetical protein
VKKSVPLETRLMSNFVIDAESGCWNWSASLRRNGYGQIRCGDKNLYTHRASYEVHFGPIPDGMCVCHRCDNRKCINPAHFFLGTRADNNADRNAKGRQARGADAFRARLPMPGERNGRAKVTEEIVAAIRASTVSLCKTAEQFGISPTQIARIRKGESWQSSNRVPTQQNQENADDGHKRPA